MKETETKWLVGGKIAVTLKMAREKQGMSVYKLAERSGIAAGHIVRIESGLLCPRIDIVHRLCVALNIKLQLPLNIKLQLPFSI